MRLVWLLAAFLIVPPANAEPPKCMSLASVLGKSVVQSSLDDMSENGEAVPLGLSTTIPWAHKGRIVPENSARGFTAIIPWGQIYAGPGNRVDSPQIELRRFTLYFLSKSDKLWHRIYFTNSVTGGLYQPNYNDNESKSTTENRTSGKTVVITHADRSYHFWPASGRQSLASDDIGGIFTSIEGRVGSGAFNAHYLLSVGTDYWASLTAKWNGYKTNGDAGIGRFKWLNKKWRAAYMTTVNKSAFDACIAKNAQ